jgi:hypothetical protein
VVCVLLIAAIGDGLQSQANTPFNQQALLPGEGIVINGHMPGAAKDLSELLVESSSTQIRLTLESSYKGFWLGGQMWKGVLHADPDCPHGTHRLIVRSAEQSKPDPSLVYPIEVFDSERERHTHSASFFRKFASIRPFSAAIMLFPVAIGVFGSVYWISNRMERHMREHGQAEIYMLKKTSEGLQVTFNMGSKHGMESGMLLDIMDDAGLIVGCAHVVQCSESEAMALVVTGGRAEVGHIVAIPKKTALHA